MKLLATVVMVLMFATGCDAVEATYGEDAKEAVSKYLAKRADERTNVQVDISQNIIDKGISHTVSKHDSSSEMNNLVVYFMSTNPYEGKLLARALNDKGLEIGRATVALRLGSNESKYVNFTFNPEMNSLVVAKYSIDEIK